LANRECVVAGLLAGADELDVRGAADLVGAAVGAAVVAAVFDGAGGGAAASVLAAQPALVSAADRASRAMG
jgi:hypothetical protein